MISSQTVPKAPFFCLENIINDCIIRVSLLLFHLSEAVFLFRISGHVVIPNLSYTFWDVLSWIPGWMSGCLPAFLSTALLLIPRTLFTFSKVIITPIDSISLSLMQRIKFKVEVPLAYFWTDWELKILSKQYQVSQLRLISSLNI